MLRPMLLVLFELENSLNKAVRMEHASVCFRDKNSHKYTEMTVRKFINHNKTKEYLIKDTVQLVSCFTLLHYVSEKPGT